MNRNYTYIAALVIAIMATASVAYASPQTSEAVSTAALVPPSAQGVSTAAVTVPVTGSQASTASAPSTSDTVSTVSTPVTNDMNSTAGSLGAPVTGDQVSTVGTGALITGGQVSTATNDLVTGGQASTVGNGTSLVTSGEQSTASVSTPSTGSTQSTVGTYSGSGSSSSGSSYSGGYTGSSGNASACAAITSFMKAGASNNSGDVTKLQNFLKNVEKMNVAVTGIYDDQTIEAVKQFQNKYKDVILTPWGATQASGQVYITTLKKINQILCSQPLVLNAKELAEINSYKNGTVSGAASTEIGSAQSGLNFASNSNNSGTQNIAENTVKIDNTAAASNPSVLGKFWKFIKGLFR